MTQTKRELVVNQIRLQERIQAQAKVNLVTCGNCGSILLHEINEEPAVKCFACMREMDTSDCPDYWYEGVQDNEEFQ